VVVRKATEMKINVRDYSRVLSSSQGECSLLCILALLALLATAPCLSPMLSLCSTCAVAEATC
jgi:hypothetical protein